MANSFLGWSRRQELAGPFTVRNRGRSSIRTTAKDGEEEGEGCGMNIKIQL